MWLRISASACYLIANSGPRKVGAKTRAERNGSNAEDRRGRRRRTLKSERKKGFGCMKGRQERKEERKERTRTCRR